MLELNREEKLKMIEKLPPRLQDFFYSEDAGATLLYFGQKYNLSDEKVHLLSKLAGDVVLGIVSITSLAQEINSKILSDPQTAMALAQELYNDLLVPVLAAPVPDVVPAFGAKKPLPDVPKGQSPVQQNSISVPGRQDRYREPGAQMAPQAMPPRIVNLRKPPPQPPKAGSPLVEKLVVPKTTTPNPSFVRRGDTIGIVSPPLEGGEKGEVVSFKPVPPASTPPRPVVPQPVAPQPKVGPPLAEAPLKPSFYFAPIKKPVTPSATPPMPQPPKPIFHLPLIEASPHEILTAPVPKLSPFGRSPEGRPSVETKKQEPIVPMGQAEKRDEAPKASSTPAPGRQFILRPPGMPPAEPPHDILDLRKDKGEF